MNIINRSIYIMTLFTVLAFAPAQRRTKVIFFGDSITQAAVNPGGYIEVMRNMLQKDGKAEKYELVGAGIGGNKVYDLYLRMEDDVLSKSPDIVVVYIGVNDVWHKQLYGTGSDADKFEKFYNAIIEKLKKQQIKVVLCTPAVIGEKTDHSNQQDGDLNKYSTIIRDIAKKNNIPLVDLRKSFLDYNLKFNTENKESGILTTDRVHLNETGNTFVAEQMWNVLKAL